jgi:putative addiction module component (TIGR02574 family)
MVSFCETEEYAVDTTATLDAIRALPVEDQLDLVFQLWDQIVDAGWRPMPSPELLEELRRRLAAHDADPSRALTWEQVVEHVRRDR